MAAASSRSQTRPVSSPSSPPLPMVTSAQFCAAATAADQFPPPVRLELAFAGRSNVGKSSLLNSLMNRRNLARTSSTPGCTRQVAFYEVTMRTGAELCLVDLPGYGFAKRSKVERRHWGTLIDEYLLQRPTLTTVAILVDVRRGFEREERDLLTLLKEPGHSGRRPVQVVAIATKLDKIPRPQRQTALRDIKDVAGVRVVGFSTKDPLTVHPLWRLLLSTTPLQEQASSRPATGAS